VTSNGEGESEAPVATSDPAALLRDHRARQQVGYVELFLDVVYVFVLTRLTAVLADDLSWRGAYELLLLFLAMWWIWYRIVAKSRLPSIV